MSWRLALVCLLLSSGLTPAGSVLAQEQAADIRVLVFEQGRPVPGLRVEIGEQAGQTDADGTWQGHVRPGNTRLAIYEHSMALAVMPLRVHAGEVAQYIVTLTGEQRRALVSVESSHAEGQQSLPQARPAAAADDGEGALLGRVVSTEDGSAVAGARIFVSGTPIEARTDEDGRFQFELPVGVYAVSVLHSEFATRTVDGVRIETDSETRRDFELPPAGLELAEYVVIEPYIAGSLSSVVAIRRESTAVTDVLSAEQISRAGDSDAGAALKRVTGLTLVDGQFVYVRGLGERYSSVRLNHSSLPSPDPTRRVLPMDLFPTDIISQIVIQKTADSSMPGEFGGGTVQLTTLGFPDEALFSIGVSTAYHSESTGQTGLSYPGGRRDWTGYDDGTREVPPLLTERIADGAFLRPSNVFNPDGVSPEELEAIGEELAEKSAYSVNEKSLPADRSLSVSAGNSFQVGQDSRWGFLSALRYSDQWRLSEETRNSFRFSNTGLQPKDEQILQRTVRNIDLSAFLNAGLDLSDWTRLGFNLMLLRQSEDETRFSEGIQESQQLQRFSLEWTENELFSRQIYGEHRIDRIGLQIDWQHTDARAGREDPNSRTWRRDDDNDDGIFEFSRRADSNSQSWTTVDDDLSNWSLDLTQTLPDFGPVRVTLRGGLDRIERSRESTIRTFSFVGAIPGGSGSLGQEEILTPELIGLRGLRLREGTTPTDNYTAEQSLDARYAMLEAGLFDRLSLVAGLRIEDNFQEVISNNLTDPTAPPTVGTIDESDELQSASVTWQFMDSAQLRLGYSETLSRPDFREISPSPFIDPLIDLRTVGNPDLRVSSIENYDARIEYYFSEVDSVSLAWFSKDIVDPIERISSSGGSGTIITLQNALGATVKGWELDFYRGFGFVNEWGWLDRIRLGWLREIGLENYYAAANYADITSSVSIDPSASNSTNPDRALQGASPWVANVQVGYNSPSERFEWTLAYNNFGERISRAGTLGQPDIFEQPFGQLDFNFKYRFGDHWQLGLSIDNLLDPAVEFTQGDEITRRYKRGRKFGLSFRYTR